MHKNLFRLFLTLLGVSLLYLTWLYPPCRVYWNLLDEATFRFLRPLILSPGISQNFWAIMNHNLTDWGLDAVMLAYVVGYIFQKKAGRKVRSFEMLFIIIFCALVILSVNRYLLTEVLHLRRLSPSVAIDDGFRLSHHIKWLKIKETHHACFPSDHATTNLFFFFMMLRFVTKPWAFLAFGVATLCSLPRIIVGAHWLTDAVIGSLSIVLISMALLFDTGLFDKIKTYFLKISSPSQENTYE